MLLVALPWASHLDPNQYNHRFFYWYWFWFIDYWFFQSKILIPKYWFFWLKYWSGYWFFWSKNIDFFLDFHIDFFWFFFMGLKSVLYRYMFHVCVSLHVFHVCVSCLLENCVFLLQPFWLKFFFAAAALKKAYSFVFQQLPWKRLPWKRLPCQRLPCKRNGWKGWTSPLPKALCRPWNFVQSFAKQSDLGWGSRWLWENFEISSTRS